MKPAKIQCTDDDGPNPLDAMRICPEDYELVRKVVTNALKLDEEDLHGEHPSSHAVPLIMDDNDNEQKLNDLNLNEFAVNMFEAKRTKLIVNHVQTIAHKVEELMAHEKFNLRPEDESREH